MSHQQENAMISISKRVYEQLYLGPCYKLASFKPVPQNTDKYIEFRKNRKLEFYEEEDDIHHYSYEDYDDYLDGMSFSDIHQRQLLDQQYHMEQSKNYLDKCHNDYRNNQHLLNNNLIKLPVYHFETIEDYEDPWKLSFGKLDDDDNNNDNDELDVRDDDTVSVTDDESDYDTN